MQSFRVSSLSGLSVISQPFKVNWFQIIAVGVIIAWRWLSVENEEGPFYMKILYVALTSFVVCVIIDMSFYLLTGMSGTLLLTPLWDSKLGDWVVFFNFDWLKPGR